ncbi:TIGR04219 family outer membrane beta-barrel protein [Shewanella sp. Isolate11]|uniref:TIGR04219 family outer membrane beta-barrel protein n=1 Tax=Shewanella sp. Isolate11 TaxID=2908530 RepID=UPI001EFC92F3|nr:TIGR04219 family outer membrane beta-barrel protein [Shewanella sp. Isolate11]MCG9697483.1 TIGR04219 family outer membrane beta-barrel protein [Shewanella sp. Isolate11]
MKKTLLVCAILGSLAATSANAATLVGFKVGGDYWQADTSGTFAEKGQTQQDFDYDSSWQGSLWVAVEHPIPFVPNLKIRENSLDVDGKATLTGDWTFNNNTFTSGDITSSVNLSNTDFVLYYEILDNDLVALDVGAAYKMMHGSYSVADSGHPEERDISKGIVMASANAEVGVPGLGLYGFADVMLGIDETSVYDYSVGLGWMFDGIALDTKVRVGYRDFTFDVNGFDRITANNQFKGAFAGVEIVF